MPSTTLSSISRYRPAILAVIGAAAACAACLAYRSLQLPPSNNLHRSNAVRRRGRRSNSTRTNDIAVAIASYVQEIHHLGDYNLLGTLVPLDPRNLVSPDALRGIIAQADPNAREQAVDTGIGDFYDVFLDRLLTALFPNRTITSTEAEAVYRLIGHHIPDNTAVASAVIRHSEALATVDERTNDGADSVAATEHTWRSDEDTEGDALDSDGQTLQRTLYHIAEDRARQEGVIHRGITCNGCDEKPIRGVRWHCANCVDFDLCSNCEATNSHYKSHIFYKIRIPAPYVTMPKQDPLYPGKPHMMRPSIDPTLRKRLVASTKIEPEEIEALWDQFTCLAGTEFEDDRSGVGWALDRRAFNHAFVPRYNNFVAAPNLIYDRIFAYYDTDRNGLIGFLEWIRGIDRMHSSDVESKAKIVFSGYDIDEDGYVSRRDILRIFRAFYAIEKEATRNYVAELTEDMSLRNVMELIQSSQPLGSAFPPNNMVASNTDNARLRTKPQNDDKHALPVLSVDQPDVASREDMLRATDLRNIIPGEMSRSEQESIILDRWARRDFYVDEEEGLSAPKQSEADTRSNIYSTTSTTFETTEDRWGGYKIPEPEKDLGKEVLYQITQQGFNELLDPLFQDCEDVALNVRFSRVDRKKHAVAVQTAMEEAAKAHNDTQAILQIGIFRFSKCVVDVFCRAMNSDKYSADFRTLFHDASRNEICREEARVRLNDVYDSVEREVLDSVPAKHDSKIISMMELANEDCVTAWNVIFCRNRIKVETLDAVLDCVSYLGWIKLSSATETRREPLSSAKRSAGSFDPTMPQFRPNSLVDVQIFLSSASHTDSSDSLSDDDNASSSSVSEEIIIFRNPEGVEHIASDPHGPFFAFTVPEIKPSDPDDEANNTDGGTDVEAALPSLHTVLIVNTEEPPPAPTDSIPTPTLDSQDSANTPPKSINYRSYTHDPTIQLLFVDSSSGTDMLRSSTRPVTHSSNPYQPETDPLRPLLRHIRQLAASSRSENYIPFLASLEMAEKEIKNRKGEGLISVDEFTKHMKEGRLRCLESWMEWVSI